MTLRIGRRVIIMPDRIVGTFNGLRANGRAKIKVGSKWRYVDVARLTNGSWRFKWESQTQGARLDGTAIPNSP